MSGLLEGKVAVITGGAGYLGRAHAEEFLRRGVKVVIADQELESVTEMVSDDLMAVHVDVTDEKAIAVAIGRIRERFGRLDILVNNAAIADLDEPLDLIESDRWRRIIDVNLTGAFLMTRAAVPVMRQHNYGRVINISSGTVVLGLPRLSHYISSKAGLIGMTRSLATELGTDGITVNAVLVGYFPHPSHGHGTPEVIAHQAIPRRGEPEDLSPVVVFLASDDARWITGQAIAVDGGLLRTGG